MQPFFLRRDLIFHCHSRGWLFLRPQFTTELRDRARKRCRRSGSNNDRGHARGRCKGSPTASTDRMDIQCCNAHSILTSMLPSPSLMDALATPRRCCFWVGDENDDPNGPGVIQRRRGTDVFVLRFLQPAPTPVSRVLLSLSRAEACPHLLNCFFLWLLEWRAGRVIAPLQILFRSGVGKARGGFSVPHAAKFVNSVSGFFQDRAGLGNDGGDLRVELSNASHDVFRPRSRTLMARFSIATV